MIVFWIVAVLMFLLAACLIIIPLTQKADANDQERRDTLNKAFFKQRLFELESEDSEGLIADKAELVTELQQSLLQDVPDQVPSSSDVTSDKRQRLNSVLIPLSLVLMVALSGGMYYWLGSYQKVTHWQQVSAQLPELSKRLVDSGNVPLSDQEMDDLSLALRTHLHHSPSDAMGWLLLGKIAMANFDAGNAVAAMAKAYSESPDNSSIRYGYAQSLMATGDEHNRRQSVQLLNELIQSGSTDIRVYSLLALNAYDNKQYSLAIDYWRKMQTILGSNDERHAWLDKKIKEADGLLQKQSPISSKSIKVTVNVAPNIPVTQDMAVIVSIHDEFGSPMPVAAVRLNALSFPLTVELNDNSSLIEERLLSSLEQFRVKVRLDQDGNVATKEGDYFGESELGGFEQTVEVEVNKKY
ncbi:c-type cytochrome biogenesis protein CcmI [Vibrio sp. WJH972]